MELKDDPSWDKSRFVAAIVDEYDKDAQRKLCSQLRGLLGDLDERTRTIYLDKLGEVRRARTSREYEDIISSIVENDLSRRPIVSNSLSILNFLFEGLLSSSPADECNRWPSDLGKLGWLDEELGSRLDGLLREMNGAYLAALKAQDRQRQTARGVLPSFESVGITVEARAVSNDPYEWQDGGSVFVPEIVGTAMVASVSIGVDVGVPRSFYFQMEERDIDILLDSLRQAKSEMAALRKYLSLDPEGKVEK